MVTVTIDGITRWVEVSLDKENHLVGHIGKPGEEWSASFWWDRAKYKYPSIRIRGGDRLEHTRSHKAIVMARAFILKSIEGWPDEYGQVSLLESPWQYCWVELKSGDTYINHKTIVMAETEKAALAIGREYLSIIYGGKASVEKRTRDRRVILL